MKSEYFIKKIKSLIEKGEVDVATKLLTKVEQTATINPQLHSLKLELQKEYIISEMDNVPIRGKYPNVLFGTMEIAGQLNLYSKALNNLGGHSRVLNYYPNYLSYNSDYTYDVLSNVDSSSVLDHTREITEKAIEKFDIFHFMFNTTLMPDHSDLPILKKAGKKIFMHNVGSDIRRYSIAKKFNKYNVAKNSDEEQIVKKLEYLSSYIDHVIVADAELYEYVNTFYKNIHFVRQPIDLTQYLTSNTFTYRKNKPVIVHAPTSVLKGTKYINQAINELKIEYDFDFQLVHNKPHSEAKLMYQNADIVIDQILTGSHGTFALEVMSMNKPVICYINDYMKDFYPKELPIISAVPTNIKAVLESLIQNYELRKEIGLKGRSYVQQYHDVNKVSKQLLDIYMQNYN
ncbi:glycosyltransferase family 4 protein [bacterium LRH843]|nr:glycosyltransferase family 4 protein [bacterium LRH843]